MRGLITLTLAIFLFLLLSACDKLSEVETATDMITDQQEQVGIILKNAYIPYRSDQQQHFAAYFEIENQTGKSINVVDAHSPAFGMVMLHETIFEDGMAKMKHIEALTLASNESASFKPKGKHVMLMQPQCDLSQMSGVYLILELDDGQKLKYDIDFKKKQ